MRKAFGFPTKRRLAMWVFLLLAGALSAGGMLVSQHELRIATSVCGRDGVMRVVWSLPGRRNDDYSDPAVNVEDCSSQRDTDVAARPTADQVDAEDNASTKADAQVGR